MKRFMAVSVLVVLIFAGATWAAEPTMSPPAASPFVAQMGESGNTLYVGQNRELKIFAGAFYDRVPYVYEDYFVPQAATSIVTLASSATTATANLYPGWVQVTPTETSVLKDGVVTLTNTVGLDISLTNVASGQAAAVCKGNVLTVNVASGQPCVFQAKFKVPTFTPGTGKTPSVSVGLASNVSVANVGSGSPAWSTSISSYGTQPVLVFNVTSGAAAPVLGYSSIYATNSIGTTQVVSSITVSATDVIAVRIDATNPAAIQMMANKNSSGWQTLGVVNGSPFTTPMQPFVAAYKDTDAAVVDVQVRYVKIQMPSP